MSNSQLFVGTTSAVLVALAAAIAARRRAPRTAAAAVRDEVVPTDGELQPLDVAITAVASLEVGDALLVCEVDGIAKQRAELGDDAVDEVHAALARHLGDVLGAGDVMALVEDDRFVVVLRSLAEPVDRLVRRIVDSWAVARPGRRLHIGAAVHTPRASPLDTAESARAALFAARRR